MSDRNFSERYMQHFTAPQNIGEISDPDGACEVHHKGGGCFDRVQMTVKITDNRIEDVKYKLRACSGTIAACSATTSLAKGKTLEEVSQVTFELVNEELGTVPERKHHSIELAVKALHDAVGDYRKQSGR